VFRELDQGEPLSFCFSFYPNLEEFTGNDHQALRLAHQALEIVDRLGSPLGRVIALAAIGRALVAEGKAAEAVEPLDEAVALMQDRRVSRQVRPFTLGVLAEACLASGDEERARSSADDGIRFGREGGLRAWEIRAHLAKARIVRALDGAKGREAIEQALTDMEALIETTGARAYTPFVLEERARLASLVGDSDVNTRLEAARAAFVACEATGHAARIARELAGEPPE
ncbi:MAG: hypothetical protein JRG83_20455, partial [Deltaproteobacteria bacterium]|nr:hypothetical protein [Deltaproteobacteria bacterium]